MRQAGMARVRFGGATMLMGVKIGVTRAVYILLTSLRHFSESVSVLHHEKKMRKEILDATRLLRHFQKSVAKPNIRKIKCLQHLFLPIFRLVLRDNPCYAAATTQFLISMARTYQKMLPLWWVQEQLELSNDYPSGLAWRSEGRYHKPGEMAGVQRSDGRYYYVFLAGTRYTAHRIVYYLRTGEDPGNADVMHGSDNLTRDNRMELTLFQRKPKPAPKWRRRVRNSEGQLVYSHLAKDGVSTRQLERELGIKIED